MSEAMLSKTWCDAGTTHLSSYRNRGDEEKKEYGNVETPKGKSKGHYSREILHGSGV